MTKIVKFIKKWKYLTIFVFLVFLIPPFQSPDEPAHLRYIEFITEYKSLPSKYTYKNAELLNQSEEIQKAINETETNIIAKNPNYHNILENEDITSDEQNVLHYVFNHPPLYYIWGALIFWIGGALSIIQKIYLIRFSNIIFVLITFYYSLRFVKNLKISELAKTALVSLVNLWPMYLFVSAGVNNDVLLTTASISTLVIAYEIFTCRKKIKISKYLELALWINVGMLTKAHFAPLLLFVGYVFLDKLLTKKVKIKEIVIFIAGLIPTIIYFVSRFFIYGTLYPTPSLSKFSSEVVVDSGYKLVNICENLPILSYVKVLIYPRLGLILQNFVGNFGWLDTRVPLIVVFIFILFCGIGGLGVFKKLLRNLNDKKLIDKNILFILMPIISLEVFFVYLYLKTYIPQCYLYFPVQGRYYFPILLPIMYLIVMGIEYLFPSKWHKYAYSGIIIMIIYYLIYSISLILQRYYL